MTTYATKQAPSEMVEATRLAARRPRWTLLMVTTMRAGEATKNAISPRVRCERRVEHADVRERRAGRR